ncbi:MAG: hypothetical protein ACYTF6_14120 [Planctomycetota bacterium]|jgi:hypothetical protein
MAQGNSAIRTTFTHYLTWAALAVVAGLEAGFFYWFRPSLIMAAAALGLGVLCLLLWVPIFLRSAAFTTSVYRWIEAQEAAQLAKLETLAADFDELAFDNGRAQLRLLRDKLESLTQVLKRRLDSGEMTYGRYLGMAQEVYGAALDNLHEVAVALRSISTIDPGYLRKRLGELERERQRSADHERELKALRDRGALLDDTNRRVAQLMAQNESALTVIDQTSAALAATRTEQGHATLDAETAMAELEQLAGRAGKYAASR